MKNERFFSAIKLGAAAAISVAGLMALSGCEERPYSAAANTAPPPARSADLMGAPDHGSPYTAPPVVQPAYAPPPAYASAPTQSYDTGAVIAMAPIPNPGDPGSEEYYGGRHHGRVHDHYEAAAPGPMADNDVKSPYGEGHPAPGRHASYAAAPTPAQPAYKPKPPVYTPPMAKVPVYKAPVYAAPKTTAPKTTTYAKATTVTKTTTTYTPKAPPAVAYNTKMIEHKGAAVAAAGGAAAGVMAMDAHHAAVDAKKTAKAAIANVKQAANAAVATYKAKTTTAPVATPAPAPSGDRATRLAALQTTLTDAVGKTAILTAPARFTANQPVDVSLTLPTGFADTLHGAAQKEGVGDAAASVNMTALLSGDGFAVTPDDTQSAPLTAGQPTEFHWTVTAQPGAKGPLHADVGASLLGGGSDTLALGSVQKSAGMGIKLTPRVIGASLLVLIAALVVAWLARGRGPTRSATARRASRRAARGGRPLDMSAEPAPTTTEEVPAH